MEGTIEQEISLVRFVDELDYLKDDLINGFNLNYHKVTFESTMLNNIYQMFDIWHERGMSSSTINKLIELKNNSLNKHEFSEKLIKEFLENNSFKWNVIGLVGSVSFEVPMKSFTEVRLNQKLHRYHIGFFGKYGIQLTKEWAIKNNAIPVIYVKRNSEISKRLGVVTSFFNSFRGKFTQNALFNLLSLIEVRDNESEFEWRIIGDHELFLTSKTDKNQRIKFNLNDILGLYVKNEQEKKELSQFIKSHKENGKLVGDIPDIYLYNDIILSNSEIIQIDNLTRRKK